MRRGGSLEVVMTEPNDPDMDALECLRLAADFRELAKNAPNPKLKLYYFQWAAHWETLAVSGPNSHSGEGDCEAEIKDT